MNRDVFLKFQKGCFFLFLLLLPFMTTKFVILILFFSKVMNMVFLDKLSAFLLPVIFLFAFFTQLLDGHFFIKDRLIIKIFVGLCLLCAFEEAIAISNFNIKQLIIYQHEFALISAEILKLCGIAVNPDLVMGFSYWCDLVYDNATYLFWTFGVSYWIYCLYHKQSYDLVSVLVKTGLICFTCIAGYALIEIAYFQGSELAQQILITCNPILHRVGDGYGWWPPLLWGDVIPRMRSIFAEPSYMGIYFAFLMPFLWQRVFLKSTSVNHKRLLWAGIIFAFTMMFLTRSRTAYGICLLQMLLFILLAVWQGRREYYPGLKKLVGCCLAGVLIATVVLSTSLRGIEDLTNVSSNSRLGYIMATTRIGLAHPVFGAGSELFNYYVQENSPEFTRDNPEYQKWIKLFNIYGISGGYPQICEYTTLFAKHGFLGVAVFILPLLYALKGMVRKLKTAGDTQTFLNVSLVLLSLLGMAATGFSNHINITYCYWVILGVAFVFIADDDYNVHSKKI